MVPTKEQIKKDLQILEATPDVDRIGRACRTKNVNFSKLIGRKKPKTKQGGAA
jgi:hypothetical protein